MVEINEQVLSAGLDESWSLNRDWDDPSEMVTAIFAAMTRTRAQFYRFEIAPTGMIGTRALPIRGITGERWDS